MREFDVGAPLCGCPDAGGDMKDNIDIEDFIDAFFAENKIFSRIKWVFVLLVIGIGLGYAWAYKVFG
jgi:hypothetical protein